MHRRTHTDSDAATMLMAAGTFVLAGAGVRKQACVSAGSVTEPEV